jgi:hypothetical protein
VLAWLLDAIGVPTWAIGLLVPVRESLALFALMAALAVTAAAGLDAVQSPQWRSA